MLIFQDFSTACAGVWTTEKTCHSVLKDEIERSNALPINPLARH
jgi:hypothetical protein